MIRCLLDEGVHNIHARSEVVEEIAPPQNSIAHAGHERSITLMHHVAPRLRALEDVHRVSGQGAEQGHEPVTLCHVRHSSAMRLNTSLPSALLPENRGRLGRGVDQRLA